VVSELVTNGLEYGEGAVHLAASDDEGALEIAVSAADSGTITVRCVVRHEGPSDPD
jgi:anti-sigma regulatory factor (Ser/Thr protein kinase)